MAVLPAAVPERATDFFALGRIWVGSFMGITSSVAMVYLSERCMIAL
jgi:hypothetical protein